MGSLEGHLLPGVILLFMVIYYSVLVCLAVLRGQKSLQPPLPPREKRRYKPWQLVPPVEAIKMIGCSMAILGEFYYPLGTNNLKMIDWENPRKPFVLKDAWQHFTMYVFFLVSGVVNTISQVCLAQQNSRLERAVEALAFYVLVLVMATHIENKSTLEIRVHVLFMVPCFLVALASSIEVWVPSDPILWLFKLWMGLVLSTWMFQLCLVLYVPPSGQHWQGNTADLAFLTIFFCWHLGLGGFILAAIYGLCSLWCHRCSSWKEASNARYHLCPTEATGEELQKLQPEAALQERSV
ncbi:transmembrane epididymal protein 1A-like [Perognathus longimembris pacificus]|uniref:transmembrane epididymal protein 1A-like n=1 Tax=Perognathus longimembris pacificus TaxID=214514 RepID=UPI00201944E4|nr:transmembrane epididymal protein 1A-like [Perognathus longimembris pacificus]